MQGGPQLLVLDSSSHCSDNGSRRSSTVTSADAEDPGRIICPLGMFALFSAASKASHVGYVRAVRPGGACSEIGKPRRPNSPLTVTNRLHRLQPSLQPTAEPPRPENPYDNWEPPNRRGRASVAKTQMPVKTGQSK